MASLRFLLFRTGGGRLAARLSECIMAQDFRRSRYEPNRRNVLKRLLRVGFGIKGLEELRTASIPCARTALRLRSGY